MPPPPRHLYLHIPFCSGKCTYCVLYSVTYDAPRAARYVDALALEMDAYLRDHPALQPETIFIGGGTPSGLDEPLFERLLDHVRSRIDTSHLTEWTIEAQPGTLTPRKVAAMRAAGVNRVSFGVQALDDATLARVGRRHSVADVAASLDLLRAGGIDNASIDLIACLPGVSPEEWRATLHQAAAFNLPHTSVYALTIEEGSIMEAQIARGEFVHADDDTQVAELDAAEAILTAAGLHRYETSNYARPGSECRHNLACWRGMDYIGFGPAAASRVGLERWMNRKDVNDYIARIERGALVRREGETLTAPEDLMERLMFGFRLAEGVDLTRFGTQDAALTTHWTDTLARLRTQGIVEERHGRWILTPNGRLYADSVATELIPANA